MNEGAGVPTELRRPYLLFLGDAETETIAKTGLGLAQWAPEACLGQLRLTSSTLDLALPDLTPAEAAARGAGSLVIGVAPVGGRIPSGWTGTLLEAVDAGLDVVSGLHVPLSEVPGLQELASSRDVKLHDIRLPRRGFDVATGRKRSGKRLLTVGTDCALGKKYTALGLTRALQARGVDATFRATGQTGIMIAGSGIAIDAMVADFVAGAAEALSPDAAADHWDVIEGQGSLFHPAYAGVTLGLLHGSQPDVLILCHEPGRTHLHSYPDFPTPTLEEAADRYLEAARLTNRAVRMGGISLNTAKLDLDARRRVLTQTEAILGLPAFDPMLTPLDAVLDANLAR